MTSTEYVTIPKREYEDLLRRCEDLEDETRIPHEVVLDMFSGLTPVTAFRGHRGLTLRQLAEIAKVSPSYLSEIERGHKTGSVRVLSRIAEALNTTVDALVR